MLDMRNNKAFFAYAIALVVGLGAVIALLASYGKVSVFSALVG